MKIKTSLGIFMVAALTSHNATAQTFNVTATEREQVRQFYNLVYNASANVPPDWTGSIGTCSPGTISAAYTTATLLRVNFFRALAGSASGVTFSNTYNQDAQAAALIMSANNNLSHSPPPTWSCYSSDGAIGASDSNLAEGNAGPDAIDGFMQDGGTNNYFTGHRRNMIYPPTLTMGAGSVPATTVNGTDFVATAALYVLGRESAPARPRATRMSAGRRVDTFLINWSIHAGVSLFRVPIFRRRQSP